MPYRSPFITLGERRISAFDPCYVIAEIGVNHNGDPRIAHDMIDAASKSGADAVKFQTFKSSDLVSSSAPKAAYQESNTGAGSQIDMLSSLELPAGVYKELRDHCVEVGVSFMSTAFDAGSLQLVIDLEPVCLKWPSGEINNWPLLEQAAQSGIPVLLSTGMSNLSEIGDALDILDTHGCPSVAILQCVSNYPARIEDQNLRTIQSLADVFGRPVGFSDHTIGPYAALAARPLGMSILEKHFTLDSEQEGPDHKASIEPNEFAEMVEILRAVEKGLGDGVKKRLAVEENILSVARKSLHYSDQFPPGHQLRPEDIAIKRPGEGIPPRYYDLIVGRTLGRSVEGDTYITLEDF